MSTSKATATAFDVVTSYPQLESAWREILAGASAQSRNTSGVDGISINDVIPAAPLTIRHLSTDLKSLRFNFGKLRPHVFIKPNGKERLICVPRVHDRIVQRSVLNFLSKKYKSTLSNKISYGFIKDRTVQDAAKQACFLRLKHQWVYKTDISAFFDNIDREILVKKIQSFVRDRSLHSLLIQAINCEIDAGNQQKTKDFLKRVGLTPNRGVRQGMPLSPLFANVFLADFDQEIISKKIAAVRYADDLIFFSDSRASCEEIDAWTRDRLAKLGLSLPNLEEGSKSIIFEPRQTADFLGLGLTWNNNSAQYVLEVTKSQRDQIRLNLMTLGSISELNARGISLGNLEKAIANRIAGYLHAYRGCSNYTELCNALDDIQQKIMRKIYGELGLDLSALSPAHRSFLGLRKA